jgi:hypothetical protein
MQGDVRLLKKIRDRFAAAAASCDAAAKKIVRAADEAIAARGRDKRPPT